MMTEMNNGGRIMKEPNTGKDRDPSCRIEFQQFYPYTSGRPGKEQRSCCEMRWEG